MENLPSKMANTIFKINDLVDLRLTGNITFIYVNNKIFLVCKHLILNIPRERIQEADEINSIDEATEVFKPIRYKISPEEEFIGHCSNIQAFFENGLNTNILHSNIAFPLLKELVKQGYKPALRVFKEEIAKRFNEGTNNSRLFLYRGGYLFYLNEEEKQALKGYNSKLSKQEELSLWLKSMQKLRKARKAILAQYYKCENCNRRFKGEYFQIEGERDKLCSTCFNILSGVNQDWGEDEREREREWLKSEFGEDHEFFETLQEKLKERREIKILSIAERQKKIKAQSGYVTEHQPKPRDVNFCKTLDMITGSPGNRALREVGRKYKILKLKKKSTKK